MTTTIDIFRPPATEEDAGRILADHMPQGRAWDKKHFQGSNLNGLVRGLSSNFQSVQEKIFELVQEFDINNTVGFLDEWEKSVGIPDECIFQFTTISERQQRVIQRLRKTPIVTLAELQDYIDSFFPDDTITLSNGTALTSFEYDFEVDFLGDINDKFIIKADVETESNVFGSEFEYGFEFEFSGGPNTFLLECLLRNVIPANVAILINFVEVI